jgi:hypothetical protein
LRRLERTITPEDHAEVARRAEQIKRAGVTEAYGAVRDVSAADIGRMTPAKREALDRLFRLAGHGERMRGRKRGAVNPLRSTIQRLVMADPAAKVAKVWDRLVQLKDEDHAVVQDVDGGVVYWLDGRGKEHTTTQKRVQNIVAEMRRRSRRSPQR